LIHPLFEVALGHLMAKGAIKYDDRNWEKGMPVSEFYASLKRHLIKWMLRMDDEEHDEQIAFNAMGIVVTLLGIKLGIYPAELDDRPDYGNPLNTADLIADLEMDIQRYAEKVVVPIPLTEEKEVDDGKPCPW
jgi:hypothetical protein